MSKKQIVSSEPNAIYTWSSLSRQLDNATPLGILRDEEAKLQQEIMLLEGRLTKVREKISEGKTLYLVYHQFKRHKRKHHHRKAEKN